MARAPGPRRNVPQDSSLTDRVDETTLCIGTVWFAEETLQQQLQLHGAAAVWEQALAAGRDAFLHAARQARGEFSACVRGRGGVTALVVDRFATASLCWRADGAHLRVSPRADTLAELPPQAPLRMQALFDYLYHHVIPAPGTVFEGVYRLPAGHVLWFENGRAELIRSWLPHFTEPTGVPDLAALKEEFRTLLKQAVLRRVAPGLTGCYLSGGTDSSTVAGMLAREAGLTHSYSIGFEAEGYDEMAYARIASRHFGTVHHEYYVTPSDVVSGMPLVAAHFDQPFGNSSAVPAYYCARLAQQSGVQQLQAGDGGDELFGGNSRYAKQRLFEAYQDVPAVMRNLAAWMTRPGMLPSNSITRKLDSYVQQASLPMPDRLDLYNLLTRVSAREVLTAELLDQIDSTLPLAQQREVWAAADAGHWLNRTLAFDWRYTLAECDIPKVVGSASLAEMAVRFPLLDDDLLEFSSRLPVQYKLRGQRLRWFFKQALSDFLPQAIINKSKHGFGLPFGLWTLRDVGLAALVKDALDSLAERGFLQRSFAILLRENLLAKHPGYYGELVWILTMLELWLRATRPSWRV